MIKISLVKKTDDDGKLIMKWRNDPITRKMFYNSDVKEWDTFKNIFYDKYFENIVPPLFAMLDGEPIAFIGFMDNIEEKEHHISININPEHRGRGFAPVIISNVLIFISKNIDIFDKVVAEIKMNNVPSIKTFERAGFKYVRSEVKNNFNIKRYIWTKHSNLEAE